MKSKSVPVIDVVYSCEITKVGINKQRKNKDETVFIAQAQIPKGGNAQLDQTDQST